MTIIAMTSNPTEFEKVLLGEKLYDKAYIYFETMEVEINPDRFLPINNMLNSKGVQTDDPNEALIIQAGKDNDWVNLRICRE